MREVLLLSGGVDSVALAWSRRPSLAVTVNYGQRPFGGEFRASKAVCDTLNIKHRVIECDVSAFGSGDLSKVPALRIAPISEWWPYRNQFLITVVAMACIADGVKQLVIGTVSTDGQHADGTSEFVRMADAVLSMQEGHISVIAPALSMSTVELVRSTRVPMEVLRFAHSCHTDSIACGECRGCLKYLEVFETLRGTV